MNFYEVDTLVRLSANFTAIAGGAAVDPSDVRLYVSPPSGTTSEYTLALSQVVRDSLGTYHYDLVANQMGRWTYKWQGAGAVEVTSPDTRFIVRRTIFTVAP